MILTDCHTHTSFSSDSKTPPEETVKEAIRRGFSTLCITDHYDYLFPHDVPGGFIFDVNKYFEELQALKEKYSDKIRLNIGVELGLRNEPEFREETRDKLDSMTKEYPFDFVIGSTHLLDNYDPYYPEFWEGKKKADVLEEYFVSIIQNIDYYDCFDSYGHLDYIIRYTPDKICDYNVSDYSDIFDTILKKLIAKGKALECNSAGLKYGLGYAHPKREILERYLELGGELLTIGSDGHTPETIAYDFDKVCDMLKGVGFKYYTLYTGRKPEQIKL